MTLAELQTAVKAYGYGTEDDTFITSFLNQAYMDVASRYRWRTLEGATTITALASTSFTALPTALWYGDIRSLAPNVPTPRYVDNKSEIDDLQRDLTGLTTERGKPEVYTITGSLINWFPVPDASYNYKMYFWSVPSLLANPSDTPTFINAVYQYVLVEGACMLIASRDHNPARMQEHRDRYEQIIHQMMMKDRVRTTNTSRLFLPKSYSGMYDNRQ